MELPIRELVEEVCTACGHGPGEVESVMEILRRHWIETADDYIRCEKRLANVGLPAKLMESLALAIAQRQQPAEVDKGGPTYEELATPEWEYDDESRMHNSIIRELIKYTKPNQPEGPRQRLTKMHIHDLTNFSTSESTIEFDLGLQLWFISPDHIGVPAGSADTEHIWKPDLEFNGSVELEEMAEPETHGMFYIRERYRRWGVVHFYQRYKGKVKQSLDLRSFPFDEQVIRLRFGSWAYGAEDVLLLDRTDPALLPTFDALVQRLLEWRETGPGRIQELLEWNEEDQRDVSYLEYSVPVRRNSSYYVTHVFVSVTLLNVLVWGMFFIDPGSLNDRVQVAITYFLALVAFQFVVGESLPKINHRTHLSTFFSINYAIIAAGSIENVIAYLLWKGDDPAAAERLDRWFFGVVALCHVVLSSFYFVIACRHRRVSRGGAAELGPGLRRYSEADDPVLVAEREREKEREQQASNGKKKKGSMKAREKGRRDGSETERAKKKKGSGQPRKHTQESTTQESSDGF